MTARRRSKRMVLCPHCQTACAVYVAVYPHTRGTTAYCETHGWLHCYDPRRMASAQVHTEELWAKEGRVKREQIEIAEEATERVLTETEG